MNNGGEYGARRGNSKLFKEGSSNEIQMVTKDQILVEKTLKLEHFITRRNGEKTRSRHPRPSSRVLLPSQGPPKAQQ